MELDESRYKYILQRRIVISSVLILVCKFAAYFMTNSVGILTDALESIVNVITGFVSLYSISVALKPRDADHPFGHGKIESISASLEGLLILMAGIIIIFEAVKRLFLPDEIQKLDIGIVVVGVAGLMNYVLGYFSIRAGKKHNSIALIAGGKHLQSDTYSTIGLIIGLTILMISKKVWIDSAIAIIFGSIIVYTGIKILKETTSNLMDEADFKLLEKITHILWENRTKNWINIHNLKLVKYGNVHHIDCDLTLPCHMNISDAHHETDMMKLAIKNNYHDNIDLTIHIDTCSPEFCKKCDIDNCMLRSNDFENQEKWTIDVVTKRYPFDKQNKNSEIDIQ